MRRINLDADLLFSDCCELNKLILFLFQSVFTQTFVLHLTSFYFFLVTQNWSPRISFTFLFKLYTQDPNPIPTPYADSAWLHQSSLPINMYITICLLETQHLLQVSRTYCLKQLCQEILEEPGFGLTTWVWVNW